MLGRLHRSASLAAGLCLATLAVSAGDTPAASPARVDLGAAAAFAVLGASTVTSAGTSTVTGDIGVSPGPSVTGFPPGAILEGSLHAGDSTADAAHAAVLTAYADAAGRTPTQTGDGVLGGLTLHPGVYAAGAELSLAGQLTLDADGDPNAVFILRAGSTLGTAAGSQVLLSDGAQACNVFWQVGSTATLGAGSLLRGTILAYESISIGDGVALHGRALARNAAVTLINDAVSVAPCAGLSNTAPAITPFLATLTGATQTVHAAVGAWGVVDPRGSDAGYVVTVAASTPTVGGSASAAGTGASLMLTPATATAAAGNPAETGPVARPPQLLGTIPSTIASAPADTGQGGWDFPADAEDAKSLAIVIPGDAGAGAFSSTLTFTTAPPAAS